MGAPITRGRLRRVDCGQVKRAIQGHLEGWQGRALSMMGRITLVRSIFSSIPIYIFSNAILSKTLVFNLSNISEVSCGALVLEVMGYIFLLGMWYARLLDQGALAFSLLP